MTNNIYLKAEDLKHGNIIIDGEGNLATVTRIRRIDHDRGRLETNRGIRIVSLTELFELP